MAAHVRPLIFAITMGAQRYTLGNWRHDLLPLPAKVASQLKVIGTSCIVVDNQIPKFIAMVSILKKQLLNREILEKTIFITLSLATSALPMDMYLYV